MSASGDIDTLSVMPYYGDMKFNSNQCFSLYGKYTVLILAGSGAGSLIGKVWVWLNGTATEMQTIDLTFYGVMFALGLLMSVGAGFIPASKVE